MSGYRFGFANGQHELGRAIKAIKQGDDSFHVRSAPGVLVDAYCGLLCEDGRRYTCERKPLVQWAFEGQAGDSASHEDAAALVSWFDWEVNESADGWPHWIVTAAQMPAVRYAFADQDRYTVDVQSWCLERATHPSGWPPAIKAALALPWRMAEAWRLGLQPVVPLWGFELSSDERLIRGQLNWMLLRRNDLVKEAA